MIVRTKHGEEAVQHRLAADGGKCGHWAPPRLQPGVRPHEASPNLSQDCQ
jgi:hypothetical protein